MSNRDCFRFSFTSPMRHRIVFVAAQNNSQSSVCQQKKPDFTLDVHKFRKICLLPAMQTCTMELFFLRTSPKYDIFFFAPHLILQPLEESAVYVVNEPAAAAGGLFGWWA